MPVTEDAPTRPAAEAPTARWRNPLGNRWMVSALIFVLALTFRWLHVREFSQGPLMRGKLPMLDSQYYDQEAKRIAEGDLVGNEVFYLAPLYPYFLSAPYRAFRTENSDGTYSYPVTPALYLQCIIGALSCWLTYWVASVAFGHLAGTLAGLVMATMGVFIYYDAILMPSSLIVFLHLLALHVLVLASRSGSWPWWLASGVTLGLCAVAHGTALLVIVGVVLWIWTVCRGATQTRWMRTGLVLVGSVPLIGLVTLRNYAAGKDFVLLTCNVGKNLFIGNNPNADGSFRYYAFGVQGADLAAYLGGVRRRPQDPLPSEVSDRLTRTAVEFILRHPGKTIRLWTKKVRLFFNAVEVGTNDQFYFARRLSEVLRLPSFTSGLVIPVALTGIIYALVEWRRHLPLLIFLAAQVVSFTVTFVLARYRLVALSILVIFAAAQLVWWLTRLRQRQYRRLGLSIVPLAFFMLAVHWPIEGFHRTRGFGQQFAQVGETYLSLGEVNQAEMHFKNAIEHDFEPWGSPHVQRARCYAFLAEIQGRSQRWSEAKSMYESAIAELELEAPGPVKDRTRVELQQGLAAMRRKALRGL